MKLGYLMQAGVPDIRCQPFSGPANHVKHVFEELGNLGHEVSLLVRLDNRLWKSKDFYSFTPVAVHKLDQGLKRLLERGVRRVQSELQLPYAAWFESMRFALACQHELADCDIFYERMGWMGYGGGLAAQQMGIPLVLEVNGDHLPELESLGIGPRGLQRQLSLFLMKKAAHRATHTVATGEGWRQRFIERWHVSPDHVTTIENGSEIVGLLSREQLRAFAPLGAADESTTVIYVGAFEPWHGIQVLIRAMARVIAQGVPLRLVLVGAGTQQAALDQQIQELGLHPHVVRTGYLDAQHLAGQLASADIGVSPYCGRVEYSGLKLLDYKAAGLATIASGENGQPAVIKHGSTGLIVPPCDEEALAQAIVNLVHDLPLRRQMGQQARLEAERCHSWRNTAEQLEQLFVRLTAR